MQVKLIFTLPSFWKREQQIATPATSYAALASFSALGIPVLPFTARSRRVLGRPRIFPPLLATVIDAVFATVPDLIHLISVFPITLNYINVNIWVHVSPVLVSSVIRVFIFDVFFFFLAKWDVMSPFDFELRARCMIASCFSTGEVCAMTCPSSTSLKYKVEYNWSKLQCISSITPLKGRVYIPGGSFCFWCHIL